MASVGANTDLLRSGKLEPAHREMLAVNKNFASVVELNNPPGGVRAEVDKQIHDGLKTQVELVTSIIDGLVRLSRGDGTKVDSLRSLLSRVEETNVDLATPSGDSIVRH
ncbi:hypothetical protein [Micromonospora sp. NPDC023737]|uniref:hypothetical protein n=1 Tax=unclassified Micromonospora TaxID=2617518 RepID=UPI0033CC1687